jgi:transcription initiation factor TFIIB
MDELIHINKYFADIDFDNFQDINSYDTNLNIAYNKKCSKCDSINILEDFSEGIVVCIDCGQVNDNIVLDNKPEWNNYNDDDKNNGRCGMPINKLLPQSSLGTNIVGFGNNRLKTLQHWDAMPYKERSLSYVFKLIDDICLKYNILKCIGDDAKIMYKMISECKHTTGKNKDKFIITRGINRRSIIAAGLLFAHSRKNMSRTPKEIAEMFKITYMEINKGCKNFIKLIGLKTFDMSMNICTAEQFIVRKCNNLNINRQYILTATQIAINIDKMKIATVHTPYSIAAACILLMCEIHNLTNISKKDIATSFNISEVTIIKTYKKIEKYKDILCNNNLSINNINNNTEIPNDILEKMKEFGLDNNNNNNNNNMNITLNDKLLMISKIDIFDKNLYNMFDNYIKDVKKRINSDILCNQLI